MRDDDRIVVTGLGGVTPIGNTVEEFWKRLTSGVSGVAPITQFDTSELAVKIAAEVKAFDLGDYFEKKGGFAPVGFQLFVSIAESLQVLDIVAVARHNKTLEMGNYRKAAEDGNFFLRGFNYLFIMKKEEA